MAKRLLAALLVVSFLCAVSGFSWKAKPSNGILGEGMESLDPRIRKLVQRIAAAPDAKTAACCYGALFSNSDRKLLSQLKQANETGVAFRAAWEEVRLAGMLPRRRANSERVNPGKAEEFVRFVEGRLRIRVPFWWAQAVGSASLASCGRLAPGRVGFAPGVEEKEEIITRLHMQSVLVSPAILDKHLGGRSLKTCLSDRSCILAFYNVCGYGYPLVCVDRNTGKTEWENSVWDWGYLGGTEGRPVGNVELLNDGERVYVIGSAGMCFYIEAFHSRTGKNQFRFANFYAGEPDIDKN